jgi:signal transduction histidine kinase
MSKMKQAYKRVVNDTILFRFKVVMVSGAILFILGHYLLDQPIYPGQAKVLLLIRIAISSIFAAGFLLSFFNPFKRYAIWMANAWMVMAGAAICLMIGVTDGAASDYYEGLNLVFLAMLVMNSFYFTHSLGVGGIILALYAMASWGNLSAHLPHALQVTFFSGSTLFFVCLMTKLYGKQHYNEFKRTEQVKQSAKELDEANKKLKETEKLKDEFFANVSHELRTPLTLTLAPLESWLGGEYGACSPEQRNALETMHHNAVRLLQMVNSLLDFSRHR